MEERPYTIRNRRLVTVPNLLSLVRVLLLPPSLVALERQATAGVLPVVLALGCALGTDALDGLLARWRNWVSDLGRILDPLADKIYLGGIVVYLALARGFPLWLVALVLGRDLVLLVGAAVLARRYNVAFAANAWGKLSTLALSLLVFAYVLELESLVPWLTALAVAAVGVSLGAYVRNGWRFVRRNAVVP